MMKRLLMIASLFAFIALLTMQASAKEITVRGHLAQTVEAGGWLIIVERNGMTDKHLLLNAKRFQREPWFRLGAEADVIGVIHRDAVTIYEEVTALPARTV